MRIMPEDAEGLFEQPLADELARLALGEVTGAGTALLPNGELNGTGIDLEITDLTKGIPAITAFLSKHGAPKGSTLKYEQDDAERVVQFGTFEGVGLYINATDLDDKIYKAHPFDKFIEKVNAALGKTGRVACDHHMEEESALYIYGPSAEAMTQALTPFRKAHPMCEKSRLAQIA
jgi:hypothetical protein